MRLSVAELVILLRQQANKWPVGSKESLAIHAAASRLELSLK